MKSLSDPLGVIVRLDDHGLNNEVGCIRYGELIARLDISRPTGVIKVESPVKRAAQDRQKLRTQFC